MTHPTASASSRSHNTVHEFAKETGVFGLNMMRHHVSPAEKIVWLAATLFFAIYTSKDLYTLTQAYLDERLLTVVSAETNDSIFFSPSPSIRFQMHDKFLQIEANLSKSRLLTMLADFRSVYTVALADAIPDDTFDIKQLVRLNLRLLSEISKLEKAAIGKSPALNRMTASQSDDVSADLRTVYDFYQTAGIRVIDVKRLTGVYLCKELRVTIRSTDGRMSNVCTWHYINELLEDGFSMSTAQKGVVVFSSWQQALTVSYLHEAVSSAIFDLSGGDDFLADQHSDAPVNITAPTATAGIAQTTIISVRPVAIFERVDTAKHPCTRESRLDCAAKCLANEFVRCASCWPVTIPVRYSELTSKNMFSCPHGYLAANTSFDLQSFVAVLAKCREANATPSENRSSPEAVTSKPKRHVGFLARCQACFAVRECEVRSYSQHWREVARTANETLSAIQLKVQSFSFPVFQERLEIEWHDYVAQFGGSLGLYLGLSLAALLHLPIFLTRSFVARWRSSKAGAQAERAMVEMKYFESEYPTAAGGPDGLPGLRRLATENAFHIRALEATLSSVASQLQTISTTTRRGGRRGDVLRRSELQQQTRSKRPSVS